MKKYFFLLALLPLLASCDGPTLPEAASPDAGPASPRADAGRLPDSLGPGPDALAPGCAVPEPMVRSVWGTAVSSKPRGGFRVLADPVACSTSYSPPPKDCSRPVDGFSDGTTWCCVPTVRGSDGVFRAARATVQCFDNTMLLAGNLQAAPGNVALCSPDGKFVGWDCMD